MDTAGLKNIRGTLLLMSEALVSHLEDANKEADRVTESVDRDNSRDGNLSSALDVVETIEDVQAFVTRAAQRLTSLTKDT